MSFACTGMVPDSYPILNYTEFFIMSASKVYFTDLRTYNGDNLPKKLKRLIKTAGIGDIDFTDKYAAIKIHFGEPGNLAFLRPNYAKAVADVVKELGGKPFLTDCNTLYVGGRKNALDMACADAVNRQPAIANTLLSEHQEEHPDDHDHFHVISPETNWMSAIDHAVKLGLGTKEYELIKVK